MSKRAGWMTALAVLVALVVLWYVWRAVTPPVSRELVLYCTVQEGWCRPMVEAFEKARASRCQ